MMESGGSPGGAELNSKSVAHSGGGAMSVWSTAAATGMRPTTNGHTNDPSGNSQLLFIAVEYVDDSNVDFSSANHNTFNSEQEFTDLEDQVSPLDPNMGSTARYSPVYSMTNSENSLTTSNSSTAYNPNSIVILPNDEDNTAPASAESSFSLNGGNMDLLRQVISNRLSRQLENNLCPDLKQENDQVGLLITDQNTGISYSLASDNVDDSLDDQQDLNGMLRTLDANGGDMRLRLEEERLMESQGLVLDSIPLISLDDHVIMDNGTLVLKTDIETDLSDVVEHMDLNLEEHISQSLTDDYKSINEAFKQGNLDCGVAPMESIILDGSGKELVAPMHLKLENEYITDDFEHLDQEEETQLRRSKRQVFGKDYSDDDDFDPFNDGCSDCIVNGSTVVICTRHRMLSIIDKPVPSRARATLPGSYLSINKISNSENGEPIFGVFARKLIPKRTQFGPIEGVLMKEYSSEFASHNGIDLLLEGDAGEMHKLDTTNENLSNWMRFVRKAETARNQNLCLNQMGPSLFYISTSPILPRQELLVGYSVSYAEKRNLTLLPSDPEDVADWPCYECTMVLSSSDELLKHLNTHDKDKIVEKRPKSKKFRNRRREGVNRKPPKDGRPLSNWSKQRRIEDNVVSSTDHVDKDPLSEKENGGVNFGTFPCTDCKKVFAQAALLELHNFCHEPNAIDTSEVSSSSVEQRFVCPQCCAVFTNQFLLATHVSENHTKVRKTYKCNMCYKSFASTDRLQRHMLVHGSDESKPLQCGICKKRFLNNSALTCHVKTHKTDKQNFECPMCKKTFCHVLTHREHVQTHCVNGLYTCPDCKKEFREYRFIRKHIRAFHSGRKYSCLYCCKQFPTLDKLRMHLLKHSDHREFLCASCGKQFKRKDNLKEHTKRMHSTVRKDVVNIVKSPICKQNGLPIKKFMPKVSPTDYHRFIYKCHNCLVGFKRRGMLVNHLAKRHPDIRPDSVPELNLPILRTTRDYYCQYCDKVYKSTSKRKAHILKNHPGAELPASNRCKETTEMNGMVIPTFTQTVGSVTTNPHNCQWCHKQYASKAKLLQHQRKKHGEFLSLNQKDDGGEMGGAEDVDPLMCDDEAFMQEGQVNKKKTVGADKRKTLLTRDMEFLSANGFDADVLLTSKDDVKIQSEEPQGSDLLRDDAPGLTVDGYPAPQANHLYRIVPVSGDQDVLPVGESMLHSLLTSSVPITRAWPETAPFSPYTPR